MKILFLGDVFGRSGRDALQQYLPQIKKDHAPDITIVNGENSANGRGITEKIAKEFYEWGVNVITTGDHIWDQREMLAYVTRQPALIRPANFPADTPGKGIAEFHTSSGDHITVVNMMGHLFMKMTLDDPFQTMENILKRYKLGQNTNAIFVDYHAETTSEKMAFAHHFDGRVTSVIGTHTHIPTADAHIMENGTAYQTDAGMTGPYNSVIGVEKDIGIHRFVKKIPGKPMTPAKGSGTVCGAIVAANPSTGKAINIAPIRYGGILNQTQSSAND